MNAASKIACFLLIIFSGSALMVNAQLQIFNALCEKKINPVGVPVNGIRFSWHMKSPGRNQIQKACQVVVAKEKEDLVAAKYNVWNSGQMQGSQSLFVLYGGNRLSPGEKYYWRARVWDKENKVSQWSDINFFITALEEKDGWNKAKWIGYEDLPDSMIVAPGEQSPETLGHKAMQRPVVPLFRKTFAVNKKIKQALVFVCGLGQYEMSINGVKTGDNFLTPGWTYYDKRCLYDVYDVTSSLAQGNNAIGVIVGNGFYNINRERYVKFVVAFGMPKLICKLKIMYTDGSIENVVTDETWKTSPSPITFASIFGGEDYDAQLEQPEWNKISFDGTKWKNALAVKPPGGQLVAAQDYPVKIADSFRVKKITRPEPGKYVYDFGQNSSGIIELKVSGKKGQVVKLVPGELLNKKQLSNQNASGGPYYFSYTCKGDGIEIWRPRFTYYGFRYVQVEGAVPDTVPGTELPKIIEMLSLHNRNSAPATGSFHCSNSLFNQVNELIRWAVKSNLQSVLTDCPHREKLSWLEVDHLMGNSIHYNYDIYHLFSKQIQDMMDAQLLNGLVPDIAPELVVFSGGFRDSPEWGSASVILPWLVYTLYGDKEIIRRAYPMIKRYVAYLQSKSTNNILSHGLGDWYDYGPKPPGVAQLTPKALTATAIFYYDVSLLHKMAALLKEKEDEAIYAKMADEIKTAFNGKFLNLKTHVYATGSQTAMSMPLCVGLVDESNRKQVLKNLTDSIRNSNKALTAGGVGFHFLVQALDEGGASQLLYEMNNRNDVAGYGYQLKKGATSLTESWAALEEVSNNHVMLGHIMEWFYSGLAGIGQEKNSVGFNHIKIRPQPVGDITSAQGSFQSPYGLITSDWKKIGNTFSLKVEIPVNTIATVYLPASAKSSIREGGSLITGRKEIRNLKFENELASVQIGSGVYNFEVRE